MSSLYITEYSQISRQGVGVGSAQAPQETVLAEQKLTIGGGSTASAAFNANTRLVRLQSDAVCSVLFGSSSVVATANSQRLAAGVSEYHGIPPYQVVSKVAVITNS